MEQDLSTREVCCICIHALLQSRVQGLSGHCARADRGAAGRRVHQERAAAAEPGHGAAQSLLPPGALPALDMAAYLPPSSCTSAHAPVSEAEPCLHAKGRPNMALSHCLHPFHEDMLAFCHIWVAEMQEARPVHEAATFVSESLLVQFLCRGLEDYVTFEQQRAGQQLPELEQLVQASGKMVLLNKLLPKLRAEGHKVCCCAHTGIRCHGRVYTPAMCQILRLQQLQVAGK